MKNANPPYTRPVAGTLAFALSALSASAGAQTDATNDIAASAAASTAVAQQVPLPMSTPAANASAGASGAVGTAGMQAGAISPSAFQVSPITPPMPGAGFVANPFNQSLLPQAGIPSAGSAGAQVPTAVAPGGFQYYSYPIYVPYPVAVGGGPAYPTGPGAAASESEEYGAPPPRVDYRSVPGGRANTDLDDPAFRSTVTR